VPIAAFGQSFPTGWIGWTIALFPGCAFAVLGFTRAGWKAVPYPNLQTPVDRLLGHGTYSYLFLSAGVFAVLGTAATITGLLGLAHTYLLGLSGSPELTSVFMLGCGTGMLCVFIGQRRLRGEA
jgi:hypothetical protein